MWEGGEGGLHPLPLPWHLIILKRPGGGGSIQPSQPSLQPSLQPSPAHPRNNEKGLN